MRADSVCCAPVHACVRACRALPFCHPACAFEHGCRRLRARRSLQFVQEAVDTLRRRVRNAPEQVRLLPSLHSPAV